MNELSLFGEDALPKLYKACETLAKSSMIPIHLRQKPQDVFAILVMGQELGIKPMQALNSINVIQGKPTISPQLMIAMIKSRLPEAIIKITSANGSVKCYTARSKDDLESGMFYESTWDMTKAKAMGLAQKDNYIKQPETMFRWRAVAESCRVTFPDILMGMYAPEEFQDIDGEIIKQKPLIDNSPLPNASDIDKDFPIPEEEKTVGPLYRIQQGKYKAKQLKDLTIEEIEEYNSDILSRKSLKSWEKDLVNIFDEYVSMIKVENEQ